VQLGFARPQMKLENGFAEIIGDRGIHRTNHAKEKQD
jgi:hypothetical protein